MTRQSDKLTTYRDKRDFRKTPEPSGRGRKSVPKLKRDDNPIFVVQQHAADARRKQVRSEPRSVLSARTIEQVAEEDDAGG